MLSVIKAPEGLSASVEIDELMWQPHPHIVCKWLVNKIGKNLKKKKKDQFVDLLLKPMCKVNLEYFTHKIHQITGLTLSAYCRLES